VPRISYTPYSKNWLLGMLDLKAVKIGKVGVEWLAGISFALDGEIGLRNESCQVDYAQRYESIGRTDGGTIPTGKSLRMFESFR
jgi:hypothetical protein